MEDFQNTTDVGAGMHTYDGIWPILCGWGGESWAGWQLMEVGPLRTLVIMQGIGGLC